MLEIYDSIINGTIINLQTVQQLFICENSKLTKVFLQLKEVGETPDQYKDCIIKLKKLDDLEVLLRGPCLLTDLLLLGSSVKLRSLFIYCLHVL